MRGASYPAVTDGDVLESLIPLPPIDAQRRIVARIEALFTRIEEARRLRDAGCLDIERLLDAVTQETLEGLERVAFKTLVEDYRNGIYKKKRFYGRGYSSVRMYNIADGQVNVEDAPLLEVTPEELEKFGLLPGDVLVNRVNSRKLVGKTGLVGDDLGPCTYESKNIRVRVKRELVEPAFAVIALNSPQVKQQIQQLMKPAIGQATINQSDLDSLCVPFIDLSGQRRTINYLRRVRKEVKSLQRAIEATNIDLDRLEQSILARAFRGEL